MKLADFTPTYLKTNYLFGIPLRDAAGNPLPDPAIQAQIDAALAKFSREVDVALAPRRVLSRPDPGKVLGVDFEEEGEPLPYHRTPSGFWADVRLPHNNIIAIQRLRGFFGTQALYTFPLEWIDLKHREGYLRLVPSKGSIGGLLVSGDGDVRILQVSLAQRDHLPGFWCADYTYGLAANADIPADVLDWLAKTAAIPILDMLASALTQGQTSRSLSMDGISESTSVAQGGGKSLFANRIDSYREELKEVNVQAFRRYFRGLKVWSA